MLDIVSIVDAVLLHLMGDWANSRKSDGDVELLALRFVVDGSGSDQLSSV